jgi:PAS domain S-box-containing protein
MFIKDLSGHYQYVNETFTGSFGRPRHELIARTDAEIFPAEVAAQFAANDAKVLAARTGIQFEEVAQYRDGRIHTSIVHKFPMFDANGEVIGIGG